MRDKELGDIATLVFRTYRRLVVKGGVVGLVVPYWFS